MDSGARGVPKLVDPCEAEIIRDHVERPRRQEQVNGVKRVAEIDGEVRAEVEDRYRAGVELPRLDQPPVSIQVEVRARFQLQCDEKGVLANGCGDTDVSAKAIEFKERHACAAGCAGKQPRRIGQSYGVRD